MNDEILEVSLNGKTYSLKQSKLREWIHLESVRTKVLEHSERREHKAFSDALCLYVSVYMGVDKEEILAVPWWEAIMVFLECVNFNQPKIDLPIFKSRYEKQKKIPWDYEKRDWYIWVDNLASNYGWTVNQIAELELDDAFALAQEIATREQLEMEWEWTRTEVAYPYNAQSKKHHFKPLKRPFWMLGTDPGKPVEKTKIPKSMLPVGNIIGDKSKDGEDFIH